jgi:hypothetical protein
MKKRILGVMVCLALVLATIPTVAVPAPALAAGTTEVHVVKYAPDGTTVLDEVTVTLAEMTADSAELPVYGNGSTHYYFQGPIFVNEWQTAHPGEIWNDTLICNGDKVPGTTVTLKNAPACIEYDRWNPDEDTNCGGPEGAVPKDLGAVKGTAVNDLCELVGGLSSGDTVRIVATDGFYKDFTADIFYDPPAAVGTGILCWYTKNCQESFAGTGYVPEFSVGMRLAFLADTSNNPWGYHVFGIKDMVENFPSEIWHYYYGGPGDFYPSCGGFQIKCVNEIIIYTSESSGEPDEDSDSLDAKAIVILSMVGISLDRARIDYGDIAPGENSEVETVGISNVGTVDVDVTLEVDGDDATAQDFYEQSLYIDNRLYDIDTVIASIDEDESEDVDTRLKVPADWDEAGTQEATFIFWAEAS